MTDMVMSLASKFLRALDSRETLDLVVRSACTFYGCDWCGILNLQKDLDARTPLHWYNAATGGMKDTVHFYEYEVITQYPQWKKVIEERAIICIRDLDQVASSYSMELKHYYGCRLDLSFLCHFTGRLPDFFWYGIRSGSWTTLLS